MGRNAVGVEEETRTTARDRYRWLRVKRPLQRCRGSQAQQSLGQPEGVDGPELHGPGYEVPDLAAGGRRDAADPLRRDGLSAVDGAQQGTGNGGIGVGVAARHHGLHDAFFQSGRVQELVEGVLQGDQHPALVRLVVSRRSLGRLAECLHHGRGRAGPLGLIQRSLVALPGGRSGGDRRGNRGHKDGAGVLAHPMGMRQTAVG